MKSVLFVCAILFAFQFAQAGKDSKKEYSYPTEAGPELGRKTVELDLIKEYEKELESEKAALSAGASEAERNSAISKKFEQKNQVVFDEVRKLAVESGSGVGSITKAQAQKILDKVPSHPIVSDKGSAKYDTPMRQIGYCFGKAAFVHVELLRHGVAPASVAKMFGLGPLIHSGRGWEFHVATMVKASEGGWWVIDGLEKTVQDLDAWKANVLSWSQTPEHPLIRFYFSDALKLNPTPGAYGPKTFDVPYYKGFFRDLGRWFQKNPVKPAEVFTRK